MKISLSIFLLATAFGTCWCGAHEGPAEIIQRLSHRIDSGKGSGEDYLHRALEWRILGKSDRAARDLRLALRRDPDAQSAWRELARVSLLLNDANGAVDAARRALSIASRSPGDSDRCSAARLFLAEVLLEAGRAQDAEHEVVAAFVLDPQQGVDAWWLRAEILADLDDQSARLNCLQKGWQQTASEALRIAWIEAAIDLDRGDEVMEQVEKSLARCRLKAAWRIRRARVYVSRNERKPAKTDLLLAMKELQGRLSPTRPDQTVERELASAQRLMQLIEP